MGVCSEIRVDYPNNLEGKLNLSFNYVKWTDEAITINLDWNTKNQSNAFQLTKKAYTYNILRLTEIKDFSKCCTIYDTA